MVFLDHHSDFTCTYLMTEMTVESTREAKQVFEGPEKTINVTIKIIMPTMGYLTLSCSRSP